MRKLLAFVLGFCLLLPAFAVTADASGEQLIIVNKRINKLAFYEDGVLQKTASVATGRYASLTPEGKYKVIVKWKCPVYYATNSKGCSSTNPLGPRWLGLNVPGTNGYTYGIHGNNNDASIGTYASSGCVRMHNWEITWLFDQVNVGANVIITNSSKSFDDIAEMNGFRIGYPVEKIDQELMLYETTYLYKEANKYTKTKAAVRNKVKAFEKTGPWYHIYTWIGPKWIHEEDVTVGKEEVLDVTLTLNSTHNLHTYPKENEKLRAAVGNQKVKVTTKIGNWYKIKTWIGEKWIYEENPIIGEPTIVEKELELTKTTSFYSEPFGNGKWKGALGAQKVKVTAEWGEWYQVKTWVGDSWIKKDA